MLNVCDKFHDNAEICCDNDSAEICCDEICCDSDDDVIFHQTCRLTVVLV